MSTYTPIASQTLTAAASSVTFSNIPQTYTDLVVVGSIKTGANTYQPILRFNEDSGSNYSSTVIAGSGSAASSNRHTNQNGIYANPGPGVGTAGNFWPWIIQVQNYTNTNVNKTVLHRFNNAESYVVAGVGLWRNTAAITSITLVAEAGSNNFQSGSTFNLYGIANASITNTAKATGGDSVYTDGTYWYHIFRSSGIFTPTQALTADYLVVAGGGGAGGDLGGAGGAGGLRCTVTATGGGGSLESPLSLTAQAYTVTIGAGGAGNTAAAVGTNGSNSVFSTITSTGGGGGGGDTSTVTGNSGGSGGGASSDGGSSTARTGASGTANQGFKGGNKLGGAYYQSAAGGGGAGAVGSDQSSTTGGNGGNGVATSISGTSVTYAGGGGGGCGPSLTSAGTGGAGGGGNGSKGTAVNGNAGTANTGGGGGGGGTSGADGGSGGSGIVIVRYAA